MSIQNNSNGTWVTTGQLSNGHWIFDGVNGYKKASTTNGILTYRNSQYTYKPIKNYIFKVDVNSFTANPNYLELITPWSGTPSFYFTQSGIWPEGVTASSTIPLSNDSTLIHMSSPTNDLSSTTRVRLSSAKFSTSYIKSINIEEVDWFFKGYSWASDNNDDYNGWRLSNNNIQFKWSSTGRYPAPFIKYKRRINSITTTPSTYFYEKSNHAYQFVNLEKFNLSFSYFNTSTASSSLDIYLMNELPSLRFSAPISNAYNGVTVVGINNSFENSLKNGQFLGKIVENGDYNFYNLSGNKYIIFITRYSTTNFNLTLSDISIKGGYLITENNKSLLLTNSDTFDDATNLSVQSNSGSTQFFIETTTSNTIHTTNSVVFGPTGGTGSYPPFFSDLYGTVTNISQLNSKVGNSNFKSGIWENGVWNNGLRDDKEVYDFNDVKNSIQILGDVKWRLQISGPTSSVSQLEIGDKVSISNIVAIDINENRKLLKKYFTIVNKDDNNIIVEVQTPFPFRRIEKDSSNHKILVSKNIWLNGAFLNGYYQGIWNDGLFKGYPYITEMYNTHWLDGEFDGGHFSSTRIEKSFLDTYFYEGNVGLTFGTTKHELKIGDIIEIQKDDITINPQYDGETKIIDIVDDYLVITDLPWGSNTTNESGLIKSQSTGLIQNFKFKDNNVADKNGRLSTNLSEIWKFNSWIDVNFSEESTTNIGKNRSFYNQSADNLSDLFDKYKLGIGDYSPLNLYGFITNDILSSESTFRDIDSQIWRKYSLGTKYQIFEDYLGDISNFDKPFSSGDSLGGLNNFYSDGWTYSISGAPGTFTFSRTIDGTFKIEHNEQSAQNFILNNSNITIPKNRYSIIEFDYLNGPDNFLYFENTDTYYNFHFIDLFNFTNFASIENGDLVYGPTHSFPNPTTTNNTGTFSVWASGIDYKKTKSTRKVEYFYNRTGLDLGMISLSIYNFFGALTQSYNFEIDNIKFYEVDMIPFFQYTTEDYVNRSVQVPLQGISPKIDYSDGDFSFVDNIQIRMDSLILNQSNDTIPTGPIIDLIFTSNANQ